MRKSPSDSWHLGEGTPRRPIYLRLLLDRFGVGRAAVLLGLMAWLSSIMVMVPINLLIGGSILTGVVVTTVICVTMVPAFALHELRMIRDLDMARAQLYRASITDELTGIYNRRHFLSGLRQLCAQAEHTPFAVVLFDIDDFKQVNDRYGHDAGDLVLREVADICRGALRHGDLLARYGGEEFALLLPGCERRDALEIAERIRATIAERAYPYAGEQIHCTISIGVLASQPQCAAPAILTAADHALYAAKRGGKNRIVEAAGAA